jgi:hypothetical protein
VAAHAPELLPHLQRLHEQQEVTSVGDATEFEVLEEGGLLIPKPDFYWDLFRPSDPKVLDYELPFDFVELQRAQAG